MKLKDVKKEFSETKDRLYKTLPKEINSLTVTKDELVKHKNFLKEKGIVDEAKIKFELDNYHINKKLAFVIRDAEIHERLDIAITHLDDVIKYLKENEKD